MKIAILKWPHVKLAASQFSAISKIFLRGEIPFVRITIILKLLFYRLRYSFGAKKVSSTTRPGKEDFSSGGFSGAFARFPPQRELRIITAAYPVATGVKPQPIDVRRTYPYTYERTCKCARACGRIFAQGERVHLRTRTSPTYSRGENCTRCCWCRFPSLDSIRLDSLVNACPKTTV